jgi:hypothetical protein
VRAVQLVGVVERLRAVDELRRLAAVAVHALAEVDRALRAGLGEQPEQRGALVVRLPDQAVDLTEVVSERLFAGAVAAALDEQDQQHDHEEAGARGDEPPHHQGLTVCAGPPGRATG